MPNSWGDVCRYYAAPNFESVRAMDRATRPVSHRWALALDRTSPEIREQVERACKQWNTAIRDCLRAESGLRLSPGGESQSIPIKVDSGIPPGLAEVLEEFEGLEQLLLNRPTIAQAAKSTRAMENFIDVACAACGDAAGPQV
jgi:hypothetical protein